MIKILLALSFLVPVAATPASDRCRIVHGKLYVANGNPGFRIFDLRARRVFGIGSGDALSGKELPANVRRLWLPVGNLFDADVKGDFRICASAPQRRGEMQMVRM